MKKFTEKDLKRIVKEVVEEVLSDLDFHIIVIAEPKHQQLLNRLDEGVWKHSGEKDYWYRKDVPKFDWQQLHAHIAHAKHVNTKSKQVSWNADGSRHDSHTFNTNFNGMETARAIARKVLDIPDNIQLESYDQKDKGELIVESIGNHPTGNKIFIFVLKDQNEKGLLLG
jgi:hypothetical protein